MIETGVFRTERFDGDGRSAEESRNMQLVRRIFEHLARSQFHFLYENLAESGVVDVIGLTPEKMGEAGKNPNLIPETFTKGMRFEIERAFAEGNRVCVQWSDRAETSGGRIYQNKGLSLFEFNDEGKITHYYEYLDPDNFLEAIGAK